MVAGHALWLGLALGARRSPGRSPLADFAWYYLVVTAASLAGPRPDGHAGAAGHVVRRHARGTR